MKLSDCAETMLQSSEEFRLASVKHREKIWSSQSPAEFFLRLVWDGSLSLVDDGVSMAAGSIAYIAGAFDRTD